VIKSRKSPVHAARKPADPRAIGLAMVSLTAFNLARAAEPAAPQPQVMQGVTVTEEVEAEGYKVDVASSPKFTAPLLDTPQTITVIPKALLDDQGLGSLADALRNTPGITFTLGENGNTTAGDSITMRGFDTAGSIFLDGVRDLGAVSRDTFNTEQIEIVKGPSGSDNGRGAPSGYINMSSKQPTLQDAATSKVALGTDSRMRAEVDLNQTLGNLDGAAARLNMFYDKGDRPDRDVADSGRWGFAPSLALGLGGETRAFFNFLFTKQNNTPDGGLPTIGIFDYNYTPIATPAGSTQQQIDNIAALNAAIAPLVNAAPAVDRGNFYGSPDDYEHVRANMFTAKFEHDLSDVSTLRNTSRYGRYTLQRVITGINTLGNTFTGAANSGTAVVVANPALWTVSRSRQGRNEVNEILTNQSNLTTSFATGGIAHSVSTGLEFIYERQLNRTMATSGTTLAANLYNPSTADAFGPVALTGARTDGKTVTAAAYLFDTLQFSDHWSLNAGVRLDRFRTEFASVPAPAAPPATPAASSYFEGKGNLFTGKLGLVFKPVENGSIYAAFGTSEQPPGGANFTLSSPVPNATTGVMNINAPNLDPQKATNLEVGTKWDLLDNRLVLTAAVFDTRNENDLATQDLSTGEITQYGERKVRGFELGASGMITANWQVTAGFASMDTEVVEGSATSTGAQLQYSPKVTFTSWTTYRFPFGLTIGGGARYTDSQFRNGNATQSTVTNLAVNPDAWIFDAMAGYDVNERVSLQLNLQNLWDRFYLNSINNGGSRFVLGAPRSILLSGTVRFY
jgi:catecholate siderophore receptor